MTDHQNSPPEKTDAPVADQKPGWESAVERDLLILILLAAAVGLNYLVLQAGYTNGRASPIDVGSILSLLEVILIPVMLYLLAAIRGGWGRKPVGEMVIVFVLLMGVQLFCQYSAAYVYGGAQLWSRVGLDRANLRYYADILEEYYQQHSDYPAALEQLEQEREGKISASRFGEKYPLHYARLDGQTSGTRSRYLIWYPGPDCKYDIQEGPALQAALRRLAAGRSSSWLTERTYDPTNGSLSSGDLCRDSGQ